LDERPARAAARRHTRAGLHVTRFKKKQTELCAWYTNGLLQNCFKYRLQIAGKDADDLQHIRRGRLLLQRLAEFTRALLLCRKQPHVFDRDHCLIGEDFD
jgi:hypothetical protein